MALDAGATRVVIGTAAYTDVDFLDEALAEFGDRVVVSVDARGGKLARRPAGPSRPTSRSRR